MNARYTRSPTALILNSHHATRRALCDRISSRFANVRLWEAVTIADALAVLDDVKIDVVLIDGEASGTGGLKSTRAVLAHSPNVAVVVMSAFSEPACGAAARSAGAMAFVSKRAIHSDLMDILARLVGPGDSSDRPQPD